MDETEVTDVVAEVVSACGDDPGWLCEKVVEETGNETLATIVDWLVGRPIKIGFLLVLAWVATRLANRVVQRFTNRLATSAGGRLAARRQPDAALSSLSAEVDLRAEQRFQTVGSVLKNVANVVIWAIFLLLVAGELGVALGPLLAGAGVVGIAIGLGAQGLVRDVVGGLFILVEDQYGVGDVIEAAGRNGVVERVSLRSTRLRDVEGAVWHVPNGEARVVGNRSKGWSRALVDVTIAYGADLDLATEAIMSAGQKLRNGQSVNHDILGEPSVWGIEELGELRGRAAGGARHATGRPGHRAPGTAAGGDGFAGVGRHPPGHVGPRCGTTGGAVRTGAGSVHDAGTRRSVALRWPTTAIGVHPRQTRARELWRRVPRRPPTAPARRAARGPRLPRRHRPPTERR